MSTSNRRFPAEWETQQGILLCFPHNGKDWPGKFAAVQWDFVEFIKKIAESGNEIATHSDLHQLAYQQNRHAFAEDLKRSIESLEGITGKKIRAYRAPGFSLMESNKWVFSELIQQGG